MSIVYRQVKGSALSYAEGDNNFAELAAAVNAAYYDVIGGGAIGSGEFLAKPKTKVITGTATVTLPAANTVTAGFSCDFKSLTTASVLIAPNGTDTIDGLNSSFRLPSYEVFRLVCNGTNGWVLMVKPQFFVGETKEVSGSGTPLGWLEEDGSEVSQTTYASLFAIIGSTFNRGDESGGNFRLPDSRGRAAIGAGTGLHIELFNQAAVSTGTDAITVGSNADKWITGMPIVFNILTGSITGAGISDGATLYVIRTSTTTIKLASSLANAQNGTAIDITAVGGSSTFKITSNLTARTLGQLGGEENHAMSSSELLAHTHNLPLDGGVGASSALQAARAPGGTGAPATASTGGNAAMNNVAPYIVKRKLIKT